MCVCGCEWRSTPCSRCLPGAGQHSLLLVSCRSILDSDNYSPIPVASEELYQRMVGQFPFHDAELEKVRRPEDVGGAERAPEEGAGLAGEPLERRGCRTLAPGLLPRRAALGSVWTTVPLGPAARNGSAV